MSDETKTKACNLTECEIKMLIMHHGSCLDHHDMSEGIDRINYLNKRLKSFQEPEAKPEPKPETGVTAAPVEAKTAAPNGWGA